jgi:hypothetical protein
MTAEEIASAAVDEVDRYRPPLRGQPPLGRATSLDRIDRELQLLRGALIPPTLMRVADQDVPPRHVWIVARLDEYVVFFDEQDREYGLGISGPDGKLQDINVRGDLVGCFMAR